MKHDIHHIRKRKTVKQETCFLFQVHAHRSHLRPPTRRINPKHVPCKVLRQTQVWRFLVSKTLGKFTLNFQNCDSLCHYTLRIFTQSADASPIPVQILGEPNMCQSMIASSVCCWRSVAPTFPVSSHAVTVHISLAVSHSLASFQYHFAPFCSEKGQVRPNVKIKDIRVNCPAPFSPSQASQSDVPRLPRKSLHGLTGMMRVKREWKIQRYELYDVIFLCLWLKITAVHIPGLRMRLLRGEPGSVFVRCCGFPVLRRTRGGGGPTHAETKGQEKNHSATRDRRWGLWYCCGGGDWKHKVPVTKSEHEKSTISKSYQNHKINHNKIISKS